MVLHPRSIEATWHINLPAGCRLPADDVQDVDNPVAAFAQKVLQGDGARITVERRSELRRRWLEPDELPTLQEVGLAEHRAQRRRLRIDCGPPGGG